MSTRRSLFGVDVVHGLAQTRRMTKRRTARKPVAPSQSRLGRMEIILEDVQGKLELVVEGMHNLADSNRRAIEELRSELITRIEVLESVVRQSSADIRELRVAVRQNTEDITRLNAEVTAMRQEVRIFATKAALQALETRISALEARLRSA